MGKLKLIPSIYLYQGQAVHQDTREILGNGDAVEIATGFADCGADELLVFDISATDAEHEKNISAMIRICDEADIQTIVGGNIHRLEDVKKYLYSGAKMTFLDMSKESNVKLVTEASERFGKEKIALFVSKEQGAIAEDLLADCSLLIAKDCAKQFSGLPVPTLAIEKEFSAETTGSLLQENSLYGVCGENMDLSYDFFAQKAQLREQGISVDAFEEKYSFSEFKTNADGMIPVIVQDYKTDRVLMLAYMNEQAYYQTLKTGKMTYFSRSRNELWVKGETSGHYQYVKELSMDCDMDTMLAKVRQIGVPCHTGAETCFFNELVKKEYDNTNPMKVFEDVYQVILDRKEHPKEGSNTNYLFDKGIDKILKKVGEEATEIVIAAKNPDPQEIKYEISDFLYHVMVLMAEKGVSWSEITKELSRR